MSKKTILTKMTPFLGNIGSIGAARYYYVRGEQKWLLSINSPSYNPCTWDNHGPNQLNTMHLMSKKDWDHLNRAEPLIPICIKSEASVAPSVGQSFRIHNHSYLAELPLSVTNRRRGNYSAHDDNLSISQTLSDYNNLPEYTKRLQMPLHAQVVAQTSELIKKGAYTSVLDELNFSIDTTSKSNLIPGACDWTSNIDMLIELKSKPWAELNSYEKMLLGVATYVNAKHGNGQYSLTELISKIESVIDKMAATILKTTKNIDYYSEGTSITQVLNYFEKKSGSVIEAVDTYFYWGSAEDDDNDSNWVNSGKPVEFGAYKDTEGSTDYTFLGENYEGDMELGVLDCTDNCTPQESRKLLLLFADMEKSRAKFLADKVASGEARSEVEYLAKGIQGCFERTLAPYKDKLNRFCQLLSTCTHLVCNPLHVTHEGTDNLYAAPSGQSLSENEEIYKINGHCKAASLLYSLHQELYKFWYSICPKFAGSRQFRGVVLFASPTDPTPLISYSIPTNSYNICMFQALVLASLWELKKLFREQKDFLAETFSNPEIAKSSVGKIIIGQLLAAEEVLQITRQCDTINPILSMWLHYNPCNTTHLGEQVTAESGDTLKLFMGYYELYYLLHNYSKFVNIYTDCSRAGATPESEVSEDDLYRFYELTRGHKHQDLLDFYLAPYYSSKYYYKAAK